MNWLLLDLGGIWAWLKNTSEISLWRYYAWRFCENLTLKEILWELGLIIILTFKSSLGLITTHHEFFGRIIK